MSDRKNIFLENEDELEEAETNVTLVPTLTSDKVKTDYLEKVTFYTLRLTPEDDKYSMDDVQEFLEDLSQKSLWFLSEELSKKAIKHYHTIFAYTLNLDPREEIKQWLLNKYPEKWKKQDGNKRYNLQEVNDITKCFTYISKDGDYVYGKGINPKFIDYVYSKSFQKKDTRIGQLMESRALYIQGKMTDYELFDNAVNVCINTSSTGSLNMTYIKSFVTGAKASKDPAYRKKLFDNMNL